MNLKKVFLGAATAALAGAAAITPFSAAEAGPDSRFTCLTKQGVPATVALTQRGPVPVIIWQTTLGGVYTPQVRCDIISKRFQQYYEDGTLNFLTTGRKNRLPIVCVAQYKGGPCSRDLFTLRPDANPGQTLRRLMAVRIGSAGPLNESAAREYVDIQQFLKTAPVDSSIEVPGQTAADSASSSSTETAVTPSQDPQSSTPAAAPLSIAPEASAAAEPEVVRTDALW
ncbi:MAG: COP23 domain-containing protein [Cyanobacteria bacterium P01_F01_bin.42]